MKNMVLIKKVSTLISFLFLALTAVISADIAATHIDKAIKVSVKREAKVLVSKKSEEKKRALIDYKELFELNIFSVAVLNENFLSKDPIKLPDLDAGVLEEMSVEEAPRAKPIDISNYDLYGTIVATPKIHSMATIYNKTTRKYDIYGLKEYNRFIEDIYEIVEISRKSVEIKTDGGNFTLELVKKAPSSRPSNKMRPNRTRASGRPDRAPQSDQEGITRVSDSQFIIDQRFYQDLTKDVSSLMSLQRQISFIPKLDAQKKPVGFEIRRIAPGSLFQKIGLRRGDIVKTINGRVLNAMSVQEALQLLSEMKNETNINLDLMRRNKPSSIGYEVR